jgi:hypothetical protein
MPSMWGLRSAGFKLSKFQGFKGQYPQLWRSRIFEICETLKPAFCNSTAVLPQLFALTSGLHLIHRNKETRSRNQVPRKEG